MAQDYYPLPSFHFTVDFGGQKTAFSEVSGLDQDVQVIEYRSGDSPEYSVKKISGIQKFSNITLKRGHGKGDNDFFTWLRKVKLDKPDRRNLTISLLDEEHKPVFTWKVKQVFPTKISGPSMKATANEISIESIELTHEGWELEAH